MRSATLPTAFDYTLDIDFERVITAPYRMHPGLARLPASAVQLTVLPTDSTLRAEKSAVLAMGASRHAVPGYDPADAIKSIAVHARIDCANRLFASNFALETSIAEDFAVLDGSTGRLLWLCVCTPSHWTPEGKIGLDFAAVHRPVADNTALLAAAQPLVKLVTNGRSCWQRFVWTITPSPYFDQHPYRHARTPWPASTTSTAAFAAQCFLRVERQTFFPVGTSAPQQAIFAIRIMLQPLTQAIDTPAKASRLHAALASMSEAVLAYKSLTGARAALLRWLKAGF